MASETNQPFWKRCGGSTPQDRRNLTSVAVSMGAWALSSIGALLLIKKEIIPIGPGAWLVGVLPLAAGVMVLVAYARYLRETDELQRLIQLQALALGSGATFFALSGYQTLERLGAPVLDRGDFIIILSAFYSIGTFISWRRYR